jgi:hypothetical protein
MSTFTSSDCDECLTLNLVCDCGQNEGLEFFDVSPDPIYFNIRINNGRVYSSSVQTPLYNFVFGDTPLYTDSEDTGTGVDYTPIHGDTVELWVTREPLSKSLQNGKRETFTIYGNTGLKCVICKFVKIEIIL